MIVWFRRTASRRSSASGRSTKREDGAAGAAAGDDEGDVEDAEDGEDGGESEGLWFNEPGDPATGVTAGAAAGPCPEVAGGWL